VKFPPYILGMFTFVSLGVSPNTWSIQREGGEGILSVDDMEGRKRRRKGRRGTDRFRG